MLKKQKLLTHQDMFIQLEDMRPQYKYQKGRESQTYKYHKLHEKQAQNAALGHLRIEQLPQPFNPKIITMNGATFRLIQKGKNYEKIPKKKIPTMLVSCYMCLNVQSVPGIVDTFRCGSCNGINQCAPVYALLRCYNCKARVCYPNGVSDYIRCTRCQSVNQVAIQVKQAKKMVEEPKYHVFFDKQLTLKGDNNGTNPYAGTLEKEYQLEELLSVDEMTTYKYPEL